MFIHPVPTPLSQRAHILMGKGRRPSADELDQHFSELPSAPLSQRHESDRAGLVGCAKVWVSSEGCGEPWEGFKRGRDLLGQGHTGRCAERAMWDPGDLEERGRERSECGARARTRCMFQIRVCSGCSSSAAGVWAGSFSVGVGGGGYPVHRRRLPAPLPVGLYLLEARNASLQ